MKSLILLRHAKSGWDDPELRDFDRPLNDKGIRAAITMGRRAAAEGISPDRLVASPAVRVVQTLAQHGYVRVVPGRSGGVGLARAPEDIRLGNVVVDTEPKSQWQVERELRLRIKEAFDAAGIPFEVHHP